jgi:ribosomal protein S12 methylthiotransferase accessory factor
VQTFLASVGSCAAIYVLGFCQARNLPAESLRLHEVAFLDPGTARIDRIELEVVVPPGFPERYRAALCRVAEGTAVKRALETALAVQVTTRVQEAVA